MVGSAPVGLFKDCWVEGSGALLFSILPLREVEEGEDRPPSWQIKFPHRS